MVRERLVAGSVPLYAHPGWTERYPWLAQGTTGAGPADRPFDLRLFASAPAPAVLERWKGVRDATGCARVVHSRQVHGSRVLLHGPGALDALQPELLISQGYDGHATRERGVLLTVSVADCVPIFLVDGARRAVALLHAGWRGVAAGILESGLSALRAVAGSLPEELELHLGPAICGKCYEVGPHVHARLGLPAPAAPSPVDLRALLVERAVSAGVRRERISVSAYCTRCGDSPFFSHRAGCVERQMGLLGIRG